METSALTSTGTVVGSPGFMSPEQTEGRDVGPPSDIFSLGAVLTFAAQGQGPFGEGSTVALLYRVARSQPNTAGLPGEIRPLVEHCLAKDPRQRPTAAQLLDRLSQAPPAAYLPARPAAPRPDWPLINDEPVTQTQRRPERPTPAPGPQLDRPVAGPVPPWDRRMPVPVRHRPFRRGWLIAAAAAAVLASVGAGAFLAGNIGHVSGSAQAIKTRQDILNALPALSVSGVPNGAQLVSKLATAMQDSITADKDYQGWMADFAGSGRPCGSDPSQDPSYGAGQNASGAATTAKCAFVAIWDPMAPRYRQQVYSSTGF